ncbi:ARPP-1 family domain-containing protein [Yinghuangia aomiensis]
MCRLGRSGELAITTSAYGTLDFRNDTATAVLVPCHLAVVVRQAAQDHAMPRAVVVRPGEGLVYPHAMCVQETQGGLIRGGRHRLAILPPPLREAAADLPVRPAFDRLWPAVRAFNHSAGLPASGNLVAFLRRFATELDRFVAEFECVAEQVGAIVLIDGEVAGIERAPSSAYWRTLWEPLIRFCYGAEAVRREAAGVPAGLGTRVALGAVGGGGSVGDSAASVSDVRDADARGRALADPVGAAAASTGLPGSLAALAAAVRAADAGSKPSWTRLPRRPAPHRSSRASTRRSTGSRWGRSTRRGSWARTRCTATDRCTRR